MKTHPIISRCLVFCLLLAWSSGLTGAGSAYSREPGGFSTWVWNPWLLRSSSDDLLRFAAANDIDTLYLQIDPDMDPADYASFIRRASAQQVRVYALDGAPRWALERRLPEAFIDWLSTYQSGASAEERFAGIHVDVEPYLLPEWTSGQDALLRSWKDSIGTLLSGAGRLGLNVEADIPFWFDEHAMPGEPGTLSAWLIGRFDGVTIMAYRDSAERIADAARNELAEAAKLGKPVRIAVETNPSSETPKVTFYEEGSSLMNAQLEQVRTLLGKSPAFAGFAVHDYEGWKKLREKTAAAAASRKSSSLTAGGAAASASKAVRPAARKSIPANK